MLQSLDREEGAAWREAQESGGDTSKREKEGK